MIFGRKKNLISTIKIIKDNNLFVDQSFVKHTKKSNPTEIDEKNGQSPRVRPTDGSDESLKLEIARIQKPMSLVR